MSNKHESLDDIFKALMEGPYKGWTPYRITEQCGLSRGVIARIESGELPATYNVVRDMCTGAGKKMHLVLSNRTASDAAKAKVEMFDRLAAKKANRKTSKSLVKG